MVDRKRSNGEIRLLSEPRAQSEHSWKARLPEIMPHEWYNGKCAITLPEKHSCSKFLNLIMLLDQTKWYMRKQLDKSRLWATLKVKRLIAQALCLEAILGPQWRGDQKSPLVSLRVEETDKRVQGGWRVWNLWSRIPERGPHRKRTPEVRTVSSWVFAKCWTAHAYWEYTQSGKRQGNWQPVNSLSSWTGTSSSPSKSEYRVLGDHLGSLVEPPVGSPLSIGRGCPWNEDYARCALARLKNRPQKYEKLNSRQLTICQSKAKTLFKERQ